MAKLQAKQRFAKYINAIIWIFMTLRSDIKASVTISSVGNLGSLGHVSCCSTVTFVCHIQAYKYAMTWTVNTEIVAECILKECKLLPLQHVWNIEFSTDSSSGIFNLTFNPVAFKVGEKVIKCEDGHDSVTLPLNVIVLPQQNTTTISESQNQNSIDITIETGCLFPSDSSTLTWYYFQTDDEVMLYEDSVPVEYKDESFCKTGSCGGNGVAKKLSTLSIPDMKGGDEYYFRVEIKMDIDANDDYVVKVDSTRAYKLKPTTSGGLKTGAIVGITVAVVVIVLTAAVLLLFYFLRRRRLTAEEHSTMELK